MNLFHYNQDTIADAAASILEAKFSSKYSSDELDALRKVMLSMGASYGDINAVRADMHSEVSAPFLIAIATAIASDTSLFNSFVTNYKQKNN